jgi:MFS family permease
MGSETEKPLTPSPTLPPLPRDRDDALQASAIFASTSAESLQSNAIHPRQYPPPFARWMIVIALLLGMFLIALDLTIVATAIPRITDDYHTIRDVGWYGSGYFLTFAAFQSAWGKVFKYFNMKYAFFTAVVIFSVGSLVCALAPTSMALIIGRALTGVGAAGVTNGVYTIVACIVPPAQVAMYLSLVGMDFSIASIAGPLLGGVFTEKLSWRWCFWINLPIGGASLAVVLFFFKVPSTMTPAKASLREKLLQMDFQGTVLILSSLVCYMLALEEGGVRRPWNSSVVIGLLVGFFVLAALFGIDQWLQGDRAQIVGRIMKRRTIAGLCVFLVLSVQYFSCIIIRLQLT